MSTKTALQALNEVAKNLRRYGTSGFSTLTDNAHAIFMTQMLNEAKRTVEDLWKWDCLKTAVSFTSVIGQSDYTNTEFDNDTNERSYPVRDEKGRLMLWDVTAAQQGRLMELTRSEADHKLIVNNSVNAQSTAAAVFQNGTGLTVRFPAPALSARNYRVQAIVPQDELTATGTVLLVPWQPVVLYATMRCLEERGEEFGMSPDSWREMYDASIGAILGLTQIGMEDMVMSRV